MAGKSGTKKRPTSEGAGRRTPRPWWRIALALGGLGLLAAAVLRELRQPREERTWTGNVGGVPYNLRPPTVQRLRATFWDTENPGLLRPKAFGVGWDVNFAALARNRRRLATARHVDPTDEADIRSVIEETRRQDPQATLDDVLAAWHVRRRVEIDAAEADRVRAVYERLVVADVP